MSAQIQRNLQYSDPVAVAVEQIDHLIGVGLLVAGQRLVEGDLAEQLGIGRGPIREALRILAGDGVVELMPNRGARVRTFTRRHIAEMLNALVGLLCIGVEAFVSSSDYDAGMQKLEALLEEYPRRIKNSDGYGLLAAMARFQQTIFEVSGNSYLVELHRRVHFHHYNRQMLDIIGFANLIQVADVYRRVTVTLHQRNAVLASALFKTAVAGLVDSINAAHDAPSAP